jgi:hypothetical protein
VLSNNAATARAGRYFQFFSVEGIPSNARNSHEFYQRVELAFKIGFNESFGGSYPASALAPIRVLRSYR